MSTILDALKRVERDRGPSGHEAAGILAPEAGVRSPGRRSRARIGLGASALLVAVVLVYAGLRTGPVGLLPVSDAEAPEAAAQVSPSSAGVAPAPREADPSREGATAQAPLDPPSPANKAMVRRRLARAMAAAALKKQAELTQSLPTAGEAKSPPAKVPPRPRATATPAPRRQVAKAEPPPPSPAPAPAPVRAATSPPPPRLTLPPIPGQLSAPRTRHAGSADAIEDGRLASLMPFPEVELVSVRWHPDERRREARLMIDGRRPIDARQGDIIAGVAIHRIDPGAVELKVGRDRKRIAVGR